MTDSPFSSPNPDNPPTRPIVAIVGRPNVGKSTLFNRLIRRRRSITDSTPGVTRDPVGSDCRIGGKAVRLVDTGGFRFDGDQLDSLVAGRALEQVKRAAVILLVMDVDEVTAEDEGFIEVMREHGPRVVVVVNKVDGPEREPDVWNFHAYGFDSVIGVSAEHRRNIDALQDLIASRLPKAEEASPVVERDAPSIRLAILGKPNTGKSTLMNRLTGADHSLVSNKPGTTRDVIEAQFEFRGQRYELVDTAGIRRKSRVEEDLEYYSVNRAIGSIVSSDIVLLVIDSGEGVTDQDKKIASLVIEKGKGLVLVLNKWDTLEKIPNLRNAQEDRVRFLFPILEFAPIVPLSALEGDGVAELMSTLYKVWKQLQRKVETPKINKAMKEWNQHYSPPRDRRNVYRVRYITQISANPVRFLLFVNRKRGFPGGWIQYLINRIRKEFGFQMVPIGIELREREFRER